MAAAAVPRVLVLGGGGVFGSRVAGHLARLPELQVVVAGRRLAPLQRLKELVEGENPRHHSVPAAHPVLTRAFDVHAPGALASALDELAPAVVVHTAGPFQGADLAVAESCARSGVHYVDLADDREFVSSIGQLDALAKEHDVALLGGCSTTPALGSAVVDAYAEEFQSLERVDIALSPGNKVERGVATISGVLSFVGKRSTMLQGGREVGVVGMRSMREVAFPGVGDRLVLRCDVPDLALLPARYPSLRDVDFRAGLELRAFGLALAFCSYAAPWLDYSRLAPLFHRASLLFQDSFGTDDGAMRVVMGGVGRDGAPHEVVWSMFAGDGDGAQTPTLGAVVLSRMAARGQLRPGARPCMGEVTEAQFRDEMRGYNFHFHVNDARTSCGGGDASGARGGLYEAFCRTVRPRLPRTMLKFHCDHGCVRGRFDISRGRSLLSRALATLGGLPPEQRGCETVVVSEEGGQWRRSFDGFEMPSSLSYESGLVMERFRVMGVLPVTFGFHWRPRPALDGFEHVTKRMWVCGIPVPVALMMRADGFTEAHAEGTGWKVYTEVTLPLVGRLVEYKGDVEEDTAASSSYVREMGMSLDRS